MPTVAPLLRRAAMREVRKNGIAELAGADATFLTLHFSVLLKIFRNAELNTRFEEFRHL